MKEEEEEEEGSESVVARRKGCFQNALCIPTQKLQLQCIQRGHSSNIPISRFAWRTIPSRDASACAWFPQQASITTTTTTTITTTTLPHYHYYYKSSFGKIREIKCFSRMDDTLEDAYPAAAVAAEPTATTEMVAASVITAITIKSR
uniref:Uncharacterized protein n=1 Tax=Vespula pensylvanica TaxID=30213 RepID=A0A834NSE3_VESPE|nr:hypothetical protein H0235_011718 [Vespula pensylvanica]